MSRLATVYLPELSFKNFGHLKSVFQSCLAQFNALPQLWLRQSIYI